MCHKRTYPEPGTEMRVSRMTQWITITALTLLLAEGFVLSVFPQQVKQLLEDAERVGGDNNASTLTRAWEYYAAAAESLPLGAVKPGL